MFQLVCYFNNNVFHIFYDSYGFVLWLETMKRHELICLQQQGAVLFIVSSYVFGKSQSCHMIRIHKMSCSSFKKSGLFFWLQE